MSTTNAERVAASRASQKKRAEAGRKLYRIFAAHFQAFKAELTPEEREIMNEIAEVLEDA